MMMYMIMSNMMNSKIQTPTTKRSGLLLWMILWMMMMSFTIIQCNDVVDHVDNITDDHNIHHHDDDRIDPITSKMVQHAEQHTPLYYHHRIKKTQLLYDHNEYDNNMYHPFYDVEQRDSLNNGVNRKNHPIMMSGDDRLLLQGSSIKCVYNESGIRNAITNAPDFASKSTRIDLCSSNIFINASKGILIENKFLEFNCNKAIASNNCLLNAQSLSRIFASLNSTLVFYDIDFANGNVNKENGYRNGGVFYAEFSSIKMINCGFSNNAASYGGSMIIFDSTVKLLSNNNLTIPSVVKNNVAINNGGFIAATRSVLEINNYNFINNTADFGGAIQIENSTLKITGSDHPTLLSTIQNNVAIQNGGFIDAYDSVLEIINYNFRNNKANDGGAISIKNSTLILSGSDNPILLSTAQNNVANQSGGFLDARKSTVDIYKYNFINNTAFEGGAIFISTNSTLTLFGSMDPTIPTIYENNVADKSGGAIFGNNITTIVITQGHFIFRNNLAIKWGGGALYFYACTTTIENVVIKNNLAKRGGGALVAAGFNRQNDRSTIVLKNVLFSNNTALVNKNSIAVQDTKINLDGVSFKQFPYDLNSYDLIVTIFNEDDDIWRASLINLPSLPPPQKKRPEPQQTCIPTGNDLIKAVNICNEKSIGKVCIIDLCEGRLQMNSSSINGTNISNKNIILNCQKICPTKRCVLDGLGKSRMLYGSGYNLTVQNIIFLNGFHDISGGAIWADKNSVITIVNSSFVNNTAPFGSAVTVQNSRLTIEGFETSIVNNTGVGPPIQVLSSQLNISNAVFAGNNISKYDAALLLFNSTITASDVSFLKSRTNRLRRDLANDVDDVFDDCDVHVSVYSDDFGKQFSCMELTKSNKTFPVIDVSDGCPTRSPIAASPIMPPMTPMSRPIQALKPSPVSIPSPVLPIPSPVSPIPSPVSTRPSHTICFSGENLVEIKDVGYIPMRQLKIGDFVKSGNDLYSQIYGFGHFDHDQEVTYLQFSFDTIVNDNDKNHIIQNIVSSSLEISPKHLVFVDNVNKNKEQQSYIRAAADIVVGDILNGKHIISIQTIVRRGVYAPLTQSGDIIVNGILASNYVDTITISNEYQVVLQLNQHTWGHYIFTPQRLFCYYYIDICKNEVYINGYGIVAYLIVSISSIINWILSNTIDTNIL